MTFMRYIYLVKVIASGVLATLLYSGLTFFERDCVDRYFPQYLPTYSMAYRLSQIAVVLLSAVSYVSTVELGENKNIIKRYQVKKYLKMACIGYFVVLILLMSFTYGLEMLKIYEKLKI